MRKLTDSNSDDSDKNTSKGEKYDDVLQAVKLGHNAMASVSIPRLCYALKEEDSNLSNDDIRDRIIRDLIDIWSRATIYEHMPEEFKDQEKSEQTKEGIKQKKRTDKTRPALDVPIRIPITTTGKLISSDEPHARLEELELENGKLKEQIAQQKQQTGELIKSLNAAAGLKKQDKTTTSTKPEDSLEYKTLLTELEIIKQERDELKQLISKQMKEHPSDTFQSAADIPGLTTVTTTVPNEVEFPARELSTFFLDQRIVKDIMYIQIQGNKVVGWESDTIRAKNKAKAKG